jgi:hypothetical protein
MLDTLLDGFRKATESTLQIQQDFMRQVAQQWMSSAGTKHTGAMDWAKALNKRWETQILETLTQSRVMMDAVYRSSIEITQKMFRLTDARSPDDFRRVVEELGRRLYEISREQSTRQLNEARRWAEASLALTQNGHG